MTVHSPGYYRDAASYQAAKLEVLTAISTVVPKTFRSLMAHLNVNNHYLLGRWLATLRREGLIDWRDGKSRTLHLTADGRELASRLSIITIDSARYVAEKII